MIYLSGWQICNPLDERGKENHDVYPYNYVWIIDQALLQDAANATLRSGTLRETVCDAIIAIGVV